MDVEVLPGHGANFSGSKQQRCKEEVGEVESSHLLLFQSVNQRIGRSWFTATMVEYRNLNLPSDCSNVALISRFMRDAYLYLPAFNFSGSIIESLPGGRPPRRWGSVFDSYI